MTDLVTQARTRYPDTYKRIRSVCQFGSVDLDLHAARIVMDIAALKTRQSQSLAPTRAATGSDTKGA